MLIAFMAFVDTATLNWKMKDDILVLFHVRKLVFLSSGKQISEAVMKKRAK